MPEIDSTCVKHPHGKPPSGIAAFLSSHYTPFLTLLL
jgi:hypothetical protein